MQKMVQTAKGGCLSNNLIKLIEYAKNNKHLKEADVIENAKTRA